MKSIFREYDIRGIFEKELTRESVASIGLFFGHEIVARRKTAEPLYCVVGYDARTHSPQLFEWLGEGLLHAGVNVLDMGLVPTGVNYFAAFQSWEIGTTSVLPHASIMITGSHNPPEYNGFKMTIGGAPFFGEQITRLGEKIMAEREQAFCRVAESDVRMIAIDAKSRYIERLASDFSHLRNFTGGIAIDCGNGAAGAVLRTLLERLGLEATVLFEEPDGTFPNHHPDPSEEHNLHDLKEAMRRGGEALGIAFDGDADRIAVLTQKNNLKGDQLAVIFARAMSRAGKKPVIIGEVKCSQAMYDEIGTLGTAIMYKTGHSNLKVKLKETGADMAAEVSGHLFFNDRWYGIDDAIYGMLRVLELVKEGMDLDAEAATIAQLVSTDEIKIAVTESTKFPIVERLRELLHNPPAGFPAVHEVITIDGVRVRFDEGWGLVRASNTTPVLVTRFEASTRERCEAYRDAMNRLVEMAKKGVAVI